MKAAAASSGRLGRRRVLLVCFERFLGFDFHVT
jgi:hypothetical protein